jgi:hypothetical protein
MELQRIPTAINNLKLLQDIFKSNKKICWLQDGTLLGFVREGSIISHDTDTDVGMVFKDLDQSLVNSIIKNGFKIKYVSGYLNDSLILQIYKNKVKIDIFVYYELGDDYFYHAAFDKNETRIDYIYKKFRTTTKRFFDYDFIVPEDPMKFILTKYGDNWNIPDPTWDYARSPLNHKVHGGKLDRKKAREIFDNWLSVKKLTKENFSIDLISAAKQSKYKEHWQEDREQHLIEAMSFVNIEGNILEFGVFNGTTINIISNIFSKDTVWGFDSFEGLPEDWKTNNKKLKWPKGHFKVNELPTVNKNVNLVKGWFDKTLLSWVNNNTSNIKLLHIDCDLYSSTKTVLSLLNHLIVPGTVIIFDEMYNWKNPKDYSLYYEGEYKALYEWLNEYNREVEILSRNNYMQCAMRVL